MYEKIVVSLDSSPLAEVVLPYAKELAGELGSEVTIISVIKPRSDEQEQQNRQTYIQKITQSFQQSTEQYAQKTAKQQIAVKSAILHGKPADKIIEYLDKENCGLIIMSTHGRSGIKRWTLGSVADKVIRATKKPVILIRANIPNPHASGKYLFKKILITLDGSREAEMVIPYVGELASALKAEVTLLQVLPMGHLAITTGEYIAYTKQQMESDTLFAKNYLAKTADWLKLKGIPVETVVKLRFGKPAEEIINFADEIHADLVVMSTHGRSGLGRWVLGSIADKVLHEGKTPLMLVTSPKQ